MPFVQFRVHPGVGCARMGNSTEAYHLASEFPYFMQEEFPNLRFKPKPRRHPRGFFGSDNTSKSAVGTLASIYHPNAAFQNKFKEAEGIIFPQAARFRVFAYVYDEEDSARPQTVFEVTPALGDIFWTVTIANKKSKRTTPAPNPAVPVADPFENTASADLDSASASFLCKRLRANADIPNLAYIFLERDDADKSKVNGRLHVIGNEGELVGKTALSDLWSDDWYDSAGDGSVEATVKPKLPAMLTKAGATGVADLKFLSYGTEAPLDGGALGVVAMPGWVVIGCPDYVPDMGHFVSLWDVAFDRANENLESGAAKAQKGEHKLITVKKKFDSYKTTDYWIHIHANLCLFDDVKFVSGEAFGEPEHDPAPPRDRAHDKHPGGGIPVTSPDDDKQRSNAVEHGGAFISARTKKADLANAEKLKESDPRKPIGEWLKIAIFKRLRKPKQTMYDKTRTFLVKPPGAAEDFIDDVLPRKLGRRMDYDGGPLKGKYYEFPTYKWHGGNLRRFHGLVDASHLCGGDKSKSLRTSPATAGPLPPAAPLSAADQALLPYMDDMFWPATFSDMPMLRELAFTPLQYEQVKAWQATGPAGPTDLRMGNIYELLVPPGVKKSFASAGDADKHFADFLAASPLYAPAMIDMAHLGAMIGGSFLPGIEVGREGIIATNWSVFHGATSHFPSVRFKPASKDKHTAGTLTKDLAIPWSKDFAACDEAFWPTSRPGRTTKTGVARVKWLIDETDKIPHLNRTPADEIEYVKEYWKALGFIRRDATNKFVEQEQSWH